MARWRTEPAREGKTRGKNQACLVLELALPAVKRPNPCGRGRGRGRARPWRLQQSSAASRRSAPAAGKRQPGRKPPQPYHAERRGEQSLPAASPPSPFGLFTSEHRAVFDTLGWARSLTREGKRKKRKKFAPFLREEPRLS